MKINLPVTQKEKPFTQGTIVTKTDLKGVITYANDAFVDMSGFDREEPEMVEAMRAILASAKAAGIRAGLHCGTPDYAARAIGWGFDLVTVGGDSRFLAAAAGAAVTQFRALTRGEARTEKGAY